MVKNKKPNKTKQHQESVRSEAPATTPPPYVDQVLPEIRFETRRTNKLILTGDNFDVDSEFEVRWKIGDESALCTNVRCLNYPRLENAVLLQFKMPREAPVRKVEGDTDELEITIDEVPVATLP